MMHGAMSCRPGGEPEARPPGARRGFGSGASRSAGGARRAATAPAAEPALQWADFHLLARAFRRRVVVDGVINNAAGWRQKVRCSTWQWAWAAAGEMLLAG